LLLKRFLSAWLLGIALLGTHSRAESGPPLVPEAELRDLEVEPFQETFRQKVMRGLGDLSYRISNQLFEGETLISPWSQGFPNGMSAGFRFGRRAFDNFDLLGSWTVIDRMIFSVGYGKGLYDFKLPVPLTAGLGLNVRIGTSGVLEIKSIRQVSPADARKPPRARSATDETDEVDEGDIQELNPYLRGSNIDSPLKAKLKNLLGLVTLPVRIPFSHRTFKKHMRDGEVISYTVSGRVGFGVDVGLQILPPITDLNNAASAGADVYLSGDYQVVVLKESDRYAKVRISRIKGRGASLRFQIGGNYNQLFDGIVVFKGKKLEKRFFSYSPSWQPFRLYEDVRHETEVDLGYRYDLHSKEGREAYHRAMIGLYTHSSEIADRGGDQPVERLFNRSQVRKTESGGILGNILSFFRYNREHRKQESETEVIQPDSEVTILKSENQLNNSFRFLGAGQSRMRRVSVVIDEDGYNDIDRDPESAALLLESSIEDPITRYKELNGYAEEIEGALGESKIFPKFPEQAPNDGNPFKLGKSNFGRSSFYFGIRLDAEGIRSFLETPWNQIEDQVKKLDIRVKREDFEQAKFHSKERRADAFRESMTKLFKDRRHVMGWMRILSSIVPKGGAVKFLSANSTAFGSVQLRGNYQSPMERILQQTNQSMGIGSETDRVPLDPEAIVNGVRTDILPDGRTKISFTLAKKPEFVYFRLNPLLVPRRKAKPLQLVVFNRGDRFKEGVNEIILDPDSTDDLARRLALRVIPGGLMNFTVGYSRFGSKWGYGSSTRFRTLGLERPGTTDASPEDAEMPEDPEMPDEKDDDVE
jgi:hypothetical protein